MEIRDFYYGITTLRLISQHTVHILDPKFLEVQIWFWFNFREFQSFAMQSICFKTLLEKVSSKKKKHSKWAGENTVSRHSFFGVAVFAGFWPNSWYRFRMKWGYFTIGKKYAHVYSTGPCCHIRLHILDNTIYKLCYC